MNKISIDEAEELKDLTHKVRIASWAGALEYSALHELIALLKLAEMMLTRGLSTHTILKEIRTLLGEYA